MIVQYKIQMPKTKLQTNTGQMTNDKVQMSKKFQNPNINGGVAILKAKNLFKFLKLRNWNLHCSFHFQHQGFEKFQRNILKLFSFWKLEFGIFKMKRGFTLIESLIAISILTIAVTTSMSLTADSLATVKLSKNRLIASGLAQETVELIRNKRDNNYLEVISGSDRDWLEGINKNGGPAQPCRATRTETDGCVVELVPDTNNSRNFVNIAHVSSINRAKAEIIYKGKNDGDTVRMYRHKIGTESPGTDEKFARFVTVEELGPSGDEFMARVTVSVEWEERDGSQKVEVVTYLFDWLPI